MAKFKTKYNGDCLNKQKKFAFNRLYALYFWLLKILSKVTLSPLPTQRNHRNKQINLFLVCYRHMSWHIVYLLSVIKWEMSKKTQSFNKLTFSYNSHFNYRWHCYMTNISIALAPSSVPRVWSHLHPALCGTFAF